MHRSYVPRNHSLGIKLGNLKLSALCRTHVYISRTLFYNDDNNNYYYYLQLGCHPVAVVILHVNKT